MSWQGLLDTANLITAVCAVIGVVLAAVLGWVAIHVAKSGNDTARKESLYGQVDDVLTAALHLTAASSDLSGDPDSDPGPSQRNLRRAAEAFDSRLRMLGALGQLSDSMAGVESSKVFAESLVALALADQDLRVHGRGVLSDTLFEPDDDHTAKLLERWRTDCPNAEHYPDLVPEPDPNPFPESFRPAPEYTDELHSKLNRADWIPAPSESLRVVFPWAQERLSLVILQRVEGEPALLDSAEPDPEQQIGDDPSDPHEVDQPPWPEHALNDWLNEWWPQSVEDEVLGLDNDEIEARGGALSPEDMSGEILQNLRRAFLDRVVELVTELRATVNDQERTDAGRIRRVLDLA